MITNKIEKLQQMANFEGDVRDGNIGDFSQGVVVGERNASKLALEVIEEILKESKSQTTENDKPKPLSWKPDSTKSMG